MTTTSGILPPGLDIASVTSREKRQDTKKLGQDAFMELMITQLKNQDPMNPMESGDFLGQIAQFGTVSGINELQNSFSALATSLQSSQALQASTMVGRKVLIESDALQLAAGTPTRVGVELPLDTSQLQITISDGLGQRVQQVTLGTQKAGISDFTWDGRDALGNALPAGQYTVKAQALIDGEAQAVTTLVQAPVESVTLPRNGQPPVLNLTDYGAFQLDAIKRVL